MSRKRFSTEQIITKLREAEVLSSQGRMVPEICRQLGVSKTHTTDGEKSTANSRSTKQES